MVRLLKGLFINRPPKPKHQGYWDVDVVLQFLTTLGDNKSLRLSDLNLKIAMLMALISVDRSSDLVKLSLTHSQFSPGRAVFTLTELRKQVRPGHRCPYLIISPFEGDRTLCPLQTLNSYLNRTSGLRRVANQGPLFISFIKPHNPVYSATIARWLKSVITRAGIEGFTGHSTRGATSTKAVTTGLSVQDVLEMADWSRETTFRRIYYRPEFVCSQAVDKPGLFSHAVLSQRCMKQ